MKEIDAKNPAEVALLGKKMAHSDQTTEVQKLFVQHISTVKYFVLSLLPNPSEAEDVVQEVFLTVTAKANDFEPGTNFKAWVLTIARYKVLELFRRQKRDQKCLSEDVIELLVAETEDVDPGQDAAMIRALSKCMTKLAPKPKRMIELLYEEKMKPGAIAEEIGWEANAVYVALSRARSSLRKCIDKQIKTNPA